MDYMDAERLRTALREYAVKHQLSISEMFEKCGNSPSTGTRFMRGATESLNGKTIGVLFNQFPGLEATYQGYSEDGTNLINIPIIGLGRGCTVGALGFGQTTGTIVIPNGLLSMHGDCSAVVMGGQSKSNFGNWFFIVRAKPLSTVEKGLNTMCFVDTVQGNMFGYIHHINDGIFHVRSPSNIESAECPAEDVQRVHPVVAAFPPSPLDTSRPAVIF